MKRTVKAWASIRTDGKPFGPDILPGVGRYELLPISRNRGKANDHTLLATLAEPRRTIPVTITFNDGRPRRKAQRAGRGAK